jgi:hypothetical protein
LNLYQKVIHLLPLDGLLKVQEQFLMALKDKGNEISPTKVRKIVKQMGFGLQQNRKKSCINTTSG